MRKLIKFLKSLKDPCKLCLVKASCYQGTKCPPYEDHIRAKRSLKEWVENTAVITILVLAVFGIIFVFVLIILGAIRFHEIIF